MLYLFEIYALVAILVFALAAIVSLIVFVSVSTGGFVLRLFRRTAGPAGPRGTGWAPLSARYFSREP
jgi:hypothetical protein